MKVLVTRPREQAENLVSDLQAHGYETECLPLLEIIPDQLEQEEIDAIQDRLASADKIIAVSKNAVSLALPIMDAIEIGAELFAIGPSTAKQLRESGYEVRVPSGSYNSEALLALSEFDGVEDEQVAILCGQGGRDYLEEQLSARGARIQRIELYRRTPVPVDSLNMEQFQPDVMTAMSGDTAEALHSAIEDSGYQNWKSLPLVVPGERVRSIAEDLGFKKIVATEKPSTESLLVALGQLVNDV